MMASWVLVVALCLLVQEVLPGATSVDGTCGDAEPNGELCVNGDGGSERNNRAPEDCTLVMAPSGIANSGWGVFTLTSRKRGQRLLDQGDLIIHVPDPNPHHAQELRRLIWEYLWDGQETGGHYEGHTRVFSATSGFGSLANGVLTRHNLEHGSYSVDDAGLTRGQSPGAGAISHHHNFTWTLSKDVEAGDELFVDFGENWFRERGFEKSVPSQKFSASHLRDVGFCLDNIAPGPSLIEDAGRGAFATRDLGEGAIVAPVPVLALSRSSLEMSYKKADGTTRLGTQLLLNYCFGNANSSLLLFPYSLVVNYINHDSANPNVRLRWWNGSETYFQKPFAELQQTSTQLMLELVATRTIHRGEEIVLDYGPGWAMAWEAHVKSWRPNDEDIQHLSAERMNNDDKYSILRTQPEQQADPYPADVFTSCYYQYSHADEEGNKRAGSSDGAPTRSIAQWSPGMISPRNLRPCIVLQRDKAGESYLYTVHILNRPTLSEAERIPKGHVHIVTHVPRDAILFSDKIYTTDQHLESAFRKEMSLGDLFPEEWKDLL